MYRLVEGTRRSLLALLLLAGLVGAGLGSRAGWERWERAQQAVAEGVSLAGRPVGGLLPAELQKTVEELAAAYRQPPRNAYADVATGQLFDGVPGRSLDVEATIERVLAASPGERVEPVVRVIPPAIGRSFFQPVREGPRGRRLVAFAVNVDWGEEVLPQMLATLEALSVRVTFFPTCRWARRFPGLVQELARRGHEIGNHGLDHAHPAKLSPSALTEHIAACSAWLEASVGRKIRLYAPPYGEVTPQVLAAAGNLGQRTILWSVDTRDWMGPSAGEITARVLVNAFDGAIVLMHPKEETVAALGPMVEGLRARNLSVVPVGWLVFGAPTGEGKKEGGVDGNL